MTFKSSFQEIPPTPSPYPPATPPIPTPHHPSSSSSLPNPTPPARHPAYLPLSPSDPTDLLSILLPPLPTSSLSPYPSPAPGTLADSPTLPVCWLLQVAPSCSCTLSHLPRSPPSRAAHLSRTSEVVAGPRGPASSQGLYYAHLQSS